MATVTHTTRYDAVVRTREFVMEISSWIPFSLGRKSTTRQKKRSLGRGNLSTRQIVLHIGRPKTGTSSLQKFLTSNEDFLFENKIIYPSDPLLYRYPKHGEFVRLLERVQRDGALITDIKEVSRSLAMILEDYFDRARTIIISAEGLQNLDPYLVAEAFGNYIDDVVVVCYLREQVSHFASSYNQEIHSSLCDQTVSDFFYNRPRANYKAFTLAWSRAFPQIRFRVYAKNNLLSGDVVKDFCHEILGVAPPAYNLDGNISLNRALLAWKLEYNRRVNRGEMLKILPQYDLYRKLQKLASADPQGQRFVTPKDLAENIKLVAEPDNESIEGLLENGTLQLSDGGPSDPLIITEREFSLITDQIMRP